MAWSREARLLLVLCLLLMAARLGAVIRTIDYSGHPDEHYMIQTARRIIESGDANPHFFRYPSLPIYVSTLGFVVSDALDLTDDEGEHKFVARHGSGWPYEPRAAFFPPRLFFGLLGVLPLSLVGFLSFLLVRSHSTAARYGSLLAPLALAGSPLIQNLTVNYMNVDTCAGVFTAACVAYVIVRWERTSWLDKAFIPGVLCGLATASKYNSGLVIAPALLAISFSSAENRIRLALAFAAIFAATFFVCVPYSLIDFDRFSADVLYEMEHYKKGHPGHEAEPGVAQLKHYLSALAIQYGWGHLTMAALGAGGLLRTDWKKGLAVLSFPVLMIGYMCTNRVNFPRSVAPAFILVSVLIPVGIATLSDLLERGLKSVSRRSARPVTPLAWLVAIALVPHQNLSIILDLNVKRDSRSIALEHLPEDHKASILAPRGLCLPTRWASTQRAPASARQLVHQIEGHQGYVIVPKYASRSVPQNLRRDPKKEADFLRSEKERGRRLNRKINEALARVHATHLGTWGTTGVPTKGDAYTCPTNPLVSLYVIQ